MQKTRAKPTKTSKKKQQKKDLKLVGYMEERETADRCQREWKKKGFDLSTVLRDAFRAVLNGHAAANEWTIKESALARRLGVHKVTVARMRTRGELVDEQGPLFTQRGVLVLYDVERTRAFFMQKPVSA